MRKFGWVLLGVRPNGGSTLGVRPPGYLVTTGVVAVLLAVFSTTPVTGGQILWLCGGAGEIADRKAAKRTTKIRKSSK